MTQPEHHLLVTLVAEHIHRLEIDWDEASIKLARYQSTQDLYRAEVEKEIGLARRVLGTLYRTSVA